MWTIAERVSESADGASEGDPLNHTTKAHYCIEANGAVERCFG